MKEKNIYMAQQDCNSWTYMYEIVHIQSLHAYLLLFHDLYAMLWEMEMKGLMIWYDMVCYDIWAKTHPKSAKNFDVKNNRFNLIS